MFLANAIAFGVFNILHNLSSMQNYLLQIRADVRKIMKSVQCNQTFIFIEISKTTDSFLEICLVLKMKIVASFIT